MMEYSCLLCSLLEVADKLNAASADGWMFQQAVALPMLDDKKEILIILVKMQFGNMNINELMNKAVEGLTDPGGLGY